MTFGDRYPRGGVGKAKRAAVGGKFEGPNDFEAVFGNRPVIMEGF